MCRTMSRKVHLMVMGGVGEGKGEDEEEEEEEEEGDEDKDEAGMEEDSVRSPTDISEWVGWSSDRHR